MKQETFFFYEDLTLNHNAMPKERGIRYEFAHNEQKILKNRNSSIHHMLSLYERQIYLLKELKRIRE